MNNQSKKSRAWAQTAQGKGARIGLMSVLLVSLGAIAGCGSEPAEQASEQPAEVQTVEQTTETVETEVAEPEVVESDEVSTDTETEVTEADGTDMAAEASEAETAATSDGEAEVLSATAGKELYKSNCKLCHEPGLLNAPKTGDKEAWAERIAKGIDTLHEHSAKGFKQMPAQAVNGISEAQVHAAVDYMVEQSS